MEKGRGMVESEYAHLATSHPDPALLHPTAANTVLRCLAVEQAAGAQQQDGGSWEPASIAAMYQTTHDLSAHLVRIPEEQVCGAIAIPVRPLSCATSIGCIKFVLAGTTLFQSQQVLLTLG
jgi:hypothetical protein